MTSPGLKLLSSQEWAVGVWLWIRGAGIWTLLGLGRPQTARLALGTSLSREQTPGTKPGAGEEYLGRRFSAAGVSFSLPLLPRSPLTWTTEKMGCRGPEGEFPRVWVGRGEGSAVPGRASGAHCIFFVSCTVEVQAWEQDPTFLTTPLGIWGLNNILACPLSSSAEPPSADATGPVALRYLGKTVSSDVICFNCGKPLLSCHQMMRNVKSGFDVFCRCVRCIQESIPWSLAVWQSVSNAWWQPFLQGWRESFWKCLS